MTRVCPYKICQCFVRTQKHFSSQAPHNAFPLWTTIQKALGTTSSTKGHQMCQSVRLWRHWWSDPSRPCADARTVMSAHVAVLTSLSGWWSRALWFGTMWSCSSWKSLSGESWESGSKTSTQRTHRDTEIRDDPDCSMLLADVFWCSMCLIAVRNH